jgi:hypothetical protein
MKTSPIKKSAKKGKVFGFKPPKGMGDREMPPMPKKKKGKKMKGDYP